MYHPSRGGVRGGRDQFTWDDVKGDKHRENYIGHSVRAPVGRWQKGKDLFWYSKDKKQAGLDSDDIKAEIRRVKEEEEQLMREALGLAPKRELRPQGNRLDKREVAELLKKGRTEDEQVGGCLEGERIQGLGFAPAPKHVVASKEKSLRDLPRNESSMVQSVDIEKKGQVAERKEEQGSVLSDDDSNAERKRRKERRAAKEQRKIEKKAAKHARRDSKKESETGRKRRRRHDSSESSDE